MKLVAPSDPVLWTPAGPVTDSRAQVDHHVGDMRAIMRNAGGVSLAAPQVGLPYRWFLWEEGVAIHPVVVRAWGTRVSKAEGCLTWPGRRTFVARHINCDVEWSNRLGDRIKKSLTGWDARVFQHECEHLDGICIFPRPTPPAA